MTTGSSMVAITRIRPPQRGRARTSTAKVWRSRSAHDQPAWSVQRGVAWIGQRSRSVEIFFKRTSRPMEPTAAAAGTGHAAGAFVATAADARAPATTLSGERRDGGRHGTVPRRHSRRSDGPWASGLTALRAVPLRTRELLD